MFDPHKQGWIKKKRARPEERAFFPEENDVDTLSKASMVMDVLREDVRFFDVIRKALAAGSGVSPEQYRDLLSARKENVLTMIENKYPDWIMYRLERARGHDELNRVLSNTHLLEPCYGQLLDIPSTFGGEEDTTRGRLSSKIQAFESGFSVSGVPAAAPSSKRAAHVVRHYLPYTQTTMGGPMACTSISFAAVVRMRDHCSVTQVTERVDWVRTIALGVQVWKDWKTGPEVGARDFQTVYDLVQTPWMEKVVENMGGAPKEYGGNIDGSVLSPDDAGKAYPSLEASLDRMLKYGAGTTAVVTIGAMSLSVYSAPSPTGSGNGEFLIFDSHGSKRRLGQCTLAITQGSADAARCICDLCSVVQTNNLGAGFGNGLSVGTESVRGTYCIYVFPKRDGQ